MKVKASLNLEFNPSLVGLFVVEPTDIVRFRPEPPIRALKILI